MELGNRRKGLRGIISQESFNKRSSARYQVTTRLALAGRCEYPDFLGRGCKISIGWMLPAASLGMQISRNPWVRLQSISRMLLRNKWLDIHLHYRTFLTAYLARVLIQAASLQAAIVTPGRENRRSGFAAWLRQLIGGKNQTSPMRCMTTRVDWGACSACACVLLANTPSVSSQALGFLSLVRCNFYNNIRYKYPVSSSTMQQVNPSWQLHFAKSQMKWGWDWNFRWTHIINLQEIKQTKHGERWSIDFQIKPKPKEFACMHVWVQHTKLN